MLRARRFWPVLCAVVLALGQGFAVLAGPPDYAEERAGMVERLRRSGITNQHVLAAMRRVPRHAFVASGNPARAYEETSLPAGGGEVLHPPRVVATATQMLDPKPGERILQVGVEGGYCTALLSEITSHVYAIDLRRDVIRLAESRLKALGYSSVKWRNEKGCQGWAEKGPYDAILVTCAANKVPDALVKQLKDGGRLVVPIGEGPEQTLNRLTKVGSKLEVRAVMPVQIELMACQAPLP